MSEGLKVEKGEIEGRARDEILYNERKREKEMKSKRGRERVRVRTEKTESEKEKEKKSKKENHVINIGKSKMSMWRIEITPVAFFLIH